MHSGLAKPVFLLQDLISWSLTIQPSNQQKRSPVDALSSTLRTPNQLDFYHTPLALTIHIKRQIKSSSLQLTHLFYLCPVNLLMAYQCATSLLKQTHTVNIQTIDLWWNRNPDSQLGGITSVNTSIVLCVISGVVQSLELSVIQSMFRSGFQRLNVCQSGQFLGS